jgi:hypothetical protein
MGSKGTVRIESRFTHWIAASNRRLDRVLDHIWLPLLLKNRVFGRVRWLLVPTSRIQAARMIWLHMGWLAVFGTDLEAQDIWVMACTGMWWQWKRKNIQPNRIYSIYRIWRHGVHLWSRNRQVTMLVHFSQCMSLQCGGRKSISASVIAWCPVVHCSYSNSGWSSLGMRHFLWL